MTDSQKLRGLIRQKGLKYGFVARELGISPHSLAQKMDNRTQFRAGEIGGISKLLRLTPEERDSIFFAADVE